MVRAELDRLTATVMSRVALCALLLVPVLYGGLYLWANQDPYAGLDRVPVALVVADTGTVIDNVSHNYGDDIATELSDAGAFQWHRVSAATAEAGVADASYDFSVTIPADFSEGIASSATSAPRRSVITLTTNDTNSYLASTIGSQAATKIREAIVTKVNEEAADRLLIGLSDVRSSLVTAADGATQLTDGATTATDGSATLATGATQLSSGVGVLASGLGQLATGTSALATGAGTLATGTSALATGAGTLASGTSQLSSGATSLAAGTATLATGAGQVSEGATKVSGGAADLAAGTKDLADGTAQVSGGAAKVADGAKALADGAPALAKGAGLTSTTITSTGAALTAAQATISDQLKTDGLTQPQIDAVLTTLVPVTKGLTGSGLYATGVAAGTQEAVDGSALLSTGAAQTATGAKKAAAGAVTARDGAASLAAGAAQTAAGASSVATGATDAAAGAAKLASGASDASTGASKLATGAGDAASGAATLATGAGTVNDGAASAATGAGTAATGAESLATGATSLNSGLITLQSGAGVLRDGLANGVTSIPNSDAQTRTLQGSTIADPVSLTTAAVTSAGTYGAGMAPFFASLAGWIGIYALFLIVKPVSRRAITALHSPLKITLAGWLTPGLLGLVQMAALFGILAGILHFEVHNPVGTYAMMGLAALAFAAIILALNVWLGSVGQFIGLVLMVIQLVTAGGTFPWQTLPAPLAWLHHVVPMSYAVDGIRQLMYGGNPATAWADAGVLLLWVVGGLVLAAIGVTRMTHFRTLRDLRPSLIG
ncbi:MULTISPECIES: YhgE/Pip domain-containing protein [unclassified Cryobacterium]|uniref:YhgE/Pip domain-containing protein n=1 Tax=unclassified Cryobacterium TaxID=2649013 RepID=UPI002AB3FDC3|nr:MULTISPECIES: YhgE/Pip domain-containing protein [unclassified Cryobacterium]MDY7542331.1 YhgE/Pip domain-containing protein [Cryobacterium sp. 5B3]MEB0000349.1 YhgE/Pip domain-containing protein [Cryobacterium sp. RTS3]MEB0267779.1 YhgE/Pip domain-containing protein [Cryobacterium sp. 10I5]MEB0275924.1 YhgE/Pip domain-containing protein [Cryobacterium sp. 5B3]